jgi:lysophospholipase L1-like esterase
MRRFDAEALRSFVHGAAGMVAGARGGLCPRRLPEWASGQLDDLFFTFVERCATGVGLRFRTTARRIVLRLVTTTVDIEGGTAPRPACVAVLVDEERAGVAPLPLGDVVLLTDQLAVRGVDRREPSAVEIDLGDSAAHGAVVELLLPHDRAVELLGLDVDGDVSLVPHDDRLRWTHYGSSISHGLEAPSPDLTWPAQVAVRQRWRLRNLAFAGNALLDPFMARVIGDTPADLITLKVGINLVNADAMRYRALVPALHGFLDTIRERQAHTPLVLFTAVSCPAHEHSPGPTVMVGGRAVAARRGVEADPGALTLEDTRRALTKVYDQRRAYDPHLRLIDGRRLFGPEDVGLLHDGLHPSADGLSLIAERFTDVLRAHDVPFALP